MSIISRIKRHLPMAGQGMPSTPSTPSSRPPSSMYEEDDAESPRGQAPVSEFIDDLVKKNQIVIFMKGSPQSPMCGFSARASSILLSYGKPFAHFNVLDDPEVREGIKQYSSWPTIPQIYIGGEFIGGSDILFQMHESGELKEAIEGAFVAQS